MVDEVQTKHGERVQRYRTQVHNISTMTLQLSKPQVKKAAMVGVLISEALGLLKSECDNPVETLIAMIKATVFDNKAANDTNPESQPKLH